MYVKPELRDLSQGSRIAFVRVFRHLSQDSVSDYLDLTGDLKRRSMTRYEKGDRNPKDERVKKLVCLFNVSFNSLKKYDYKKPEHLIYLLFWLEELIPNYRLDLSQVKNINDDKIIPVYTIVNNKTLNEFEMDEFLEYNVIGVIKYYNEFKENNYGIKKDSKRYLAK